VIDRGKNVQSRAQQDVENAYGKFTVRAGAPTDRFWKAWRANKDAMRAAGWTCNKDDTTGQWMAKLWQETGVEAKTNVPPPDLGEAFAYLDYHFGTEKRHIIAIKKSATEGRARIEARHFEAADREGQQKFILAYNPAGYDVYFSINPIKGMLHKKATKNDVLEARWLWTDNDPRPGRPIKAERAEMLASLTINLPEEMPKPNRVIDSGRGYWGFCKLAAAQPVDGATYNDKKQFIRNNPLTEIVESYGRGIEQAFGEFADDCSNIDRIARLPGTINHKTGQMACVLHEFSHDEPHAIETFPQSDKKDRKSPKADKTTEDVAIDWTKVRKPGWLQSVTDLPDSVPLKLKLIAGHTGNLKDLNFDLREKNLLTKDYRSWSEVTLALAAILKRCNYTPEQVAEALSADLPCNQHIASQEDKERAIERAISKSHAPERTFDPSGHWPGGRNEETGQPKKDILNTIEAIKRLGITCMFDEFRQKEYWTGHTNKVFDGEVEDAAVTVVRVNIRTQFNFYPVVQDARDAITSACHDNRRNPVLEYYDHVRPKWDGKPRLNTMLHVYWGAKNTPLNAAIGRKFMCAIVRRSKQPGCKFDHRLVMQGWQDVMKSLSCEDLAVFPDLYTDAGDLSAEIKQQMEVGQGKQIIEFPENVGASRAKRDRNKASISRKSGRARMAYAHYATDIPYQWVGIITKNPGGYLNDPTGERRYWHVEVTFYDREAFLADKDQLYAEAVALEPTENLWLDTSELKAAHDALVAGEKEPNALAETLAELRGTVWAVNGKEEERISVADIRMHLGLLNHDLIRFHDMGIRIAEAMMTLGWIKAPKTIRCQKGEPPVSGYWRPWVAPKPAAEEDAKTAAEEVAGG
jgi:hypothetical protein